MFTIRYGSKQFSVDSEDFHIDKQRHQFGACTAKQGDLDRWLSEWPLGKVRHLELAHQGQVFVFESCTPVGPPPFDCQSTITWRLLYSGIRRAA